MYASCPIHSERAMHNYQSNVDVNLWGGLKASGASSAIVSFTLVSLSIRRRLRTVSVILCYTVIKYVLNYDNFMSQNFSLL